MLLQRDVAILEEPEHLNWFQHSSRWSDKYDHVVGIMHTNYLAYVKEGQATGFANAAAVYRINKWVCRIHCHKVGKGAMRLRKGGEGCKGLQDTFSRGVGRGGQGANGEGEKGDAIHRLHVLCSCCCLGLHHVCCHWIER